MKPRSFGKIVFLRSADDFINRTSQILTAEKISQTISNISQTLSDLHDSSLEKWLSNVGMQDLKELWGLSGKASINASKTVCTSHEHLRHAVMRTKVCVCFEKWIDNRSEKKHYNVEISLLELIKYFEFHLISFHLLFDTTFFCST